MNSFILKDSTQTSTTSFSDLFFWNLTSTLPQKIIENEPNYSDYLVQILEAETLVNIQLTLSGKFLFYIEDATKKWVDVSETRADHFYCPKYGPAFRLHKKRIQITFYGDIEILFNCIRNLTLQLNFKDHYTLKQLIGQGTTADVYKAKDRYSDRMYAVKLINRCFEQSPSTMKEIEILRAMRDCEQLLQIQAAYENEEDIHIVLELLDGGNLQQYLKNSPPLSEQATKNIIEQLLKGVSHIHKQGVIHRDLKPHNIMLRKSNNLNNICIVDFGLAEFVNDECKYEFTKCGTPGYVAPEVLLEMKYDYKVDLYSIGIIMYQLLTGVSPFKADTYSQTIRNNLEGRLDYSKVQISSCGLYFLQMLLEYNPKNRPTAIQALNHEWFIKLDSIKLTLRQGQLPMIRRVPLLKPIGSETLQMSPSSPKSTRLTRLVPKPSYILRNTRSKYAKLNQIVNSSR